VALHLSVVATGQLDYLDAWDLQKKLAGARRIGLIPDTLLLTEHPPTYTIGRRGSRTNLLIDAETLERVCVETVESGQMTKDLAILIGPEQSWMTTEQFFEAIRVNLERAMAVAA
jgi:lipoate-protein ligase B